MPDYYGKIRRLLSERADRIKDAELFSSRQYRDYFLSAAELPVEDKDKDKLKGSVIFIDDPNKTACTNGSSVFISYTSRMLDNCFSRRIKHRMLVGLKNHEDFHRLYTDFQQPQDASEAMKKGEWYYKRPFNENDASKAGIAANDIMNLIKSDAALFEPIFSLWFHISNIIEDAYIEARGTMEFPGTLRNIASLNVYTYENAEPVDVVEKLCADKDAETAARARLNIFLNSILSYAKNDVIQVEDEAYTSALLQDIYSTISDMDEGRSSEAAEDRLFYTNRILARMWPYAKDILDAIPQNNMQDSSADGTQGNSGNGSSSQSSNAQSSNAQSGNTQSGNTQSGNAQGGNAQDANAQGGNSQGQSNAQSGQPGSGAGGGLTDAQKDALRKILEHISQQIAKGAKAPAPTGQNSAPQKPQGGASKEQLQAARDKLQEATSKAKEENEKKQNDGQSQLDQDIRDVTIEIAKEELEREVEAEHESDLSKALGSYDGSKNIVVSRPKYTEGCMETYKNLVRNYGLLNISRRLQREMMSLLRDQIEGGTVRRLALGKRISTRDLARDDDSFFSRRRDPQDKADLSVCVLIDESGSMDGTNIQEARKTAIILEDFLRNMNIPCIIMGHTNNYAGISVPVYVDFDKVDGKDKYRLVSMSASGGTPTATVLNACYKHMAKRDEANKLIIVITDGEPGDNCNHAIEDMLKRAHRDNIDIFAVGIAGCGDQLRSIFGTRTIAIDDLSLLPKEMYRLIKRHVRFSS